ncbi:MAG: hypothetical protein JW953_18685 [Anaerolineae bacterium]|nr:hypothetical protein [Anaerolineae bacterium]
MKQYQKTITSVLKAVALGMAVASLVLVIMQVTTLETNVTLLGIGLFALALLSLQET